LVKPLSDSSRAELKDTGRIGFLKKHFGCQLLKNRQADADSQKKKLYIRRSGIESKFWQGLGQTTGNGQMSFFTFPAAARRGMVPASVKIYPG
jgi:hypothetical protein